jgi:type IV secretion system protein VirD4
MKRFVSLDSLNIILSRLNSLRGQGGQLHHARFAHAHELERLTTTTLDEQALLLGRTHLGGIYRVKQSNERRELGHCLVVAPPRSGKSVLAASQILSWPGSLIIVDIKGELYMQTAGYRARLGPVYVIDPRGLGHQYDPLANSTNEDALYAAAKQLLFDPKEGEGRSFTEWGIQLEVLKWQACLALNRQRGTRYRLLPFSRSLSRLGINPAAATINAISPAIAQEMLDGEYEEERDYRENRYFANSWQSSRARMYPLLTEQVVRCFNGSDFTGRDIIAGREPVSVYLRIPERQLFAKASLIRLVLESLTSEMFDTFDERNGQYCRPVLLILDEAGTVGFPSLPQYIATAAGRGISIWAALQDLDQLDGLYGVHKAKTIRNSMSAKIFYRQDDPHTAKHISETIGHRSGYSHSETLRDGEVASEGRSETAVSVITPREIMELDATDVIFLFANFKPGRGKRMEYWRFPMLSERRALAPPPVKELPPVADLALPSASASLRGTPGAWRSRGGGLRFPIDPDDFN